MQQLFKHDLKTLPYKLQKPHEPTSFHLSIKLKKSVIYWVQQESVLYDAGNIIRAITNFIHTTYAYLA